MDNRFFEKPILNSPYEYPSRHWELDAEGQPTQQIISKRRRAEFSLRLGENPVLIELNSVKEDSEEHQAGRHF
jgi:hypothetical protein